MLKTLSSLEFSMCRVLKGIDRNADLRAYIKSLNNDQSFALHQCNSLGYVEQISEFTDANGNYHFSSFGNPRVSVSGFDFLKEKSLSRRIIRAIFDVLKGTVGYIFGILTGVAVEVIVYFLTDSGAIVLFLDAVLGK